MAIALASTILIGLAALVATRLGPFTGIPTNVAPDALIPYKQVKEHTLDLHVFHAQGQSTAQARQPAVLLLFHGGGWVNGGPSQFYPQCAHLSRLGVTCISAAYRIHSRHGSTPADSLDDARDALLWVRNHAAVLQIDARRVAVGGGSAGGHLAAALGVGLPQPAEALPSRRSLDGVSSPSAQRPDALLLLNPMLDLSPGKPDHSLVAPDWLALSPMHHVVPGVPPTLVMSGTDDPEVPVDTVQTFCRRLQDVGTPCELAFFQGGQHGFFNPQMHRGRFVVPVLNRMQRFLADQGMLRGSAGS